MQWGTGLLELEGLAGVKRRERETPWGMIRRATRCWRARSQGLRGQRSCDSPRYARRASPAAYASSYRANISALAAAGCDRIIAVAIGRRHSCLHLRVRGSLLIPDQIIDYTSGATAATFVGMTRMLDSRTWHVEFRRSPTPRPSTVSASSEAAGAARGRGRRSGWERYAAVRRRPRYRERAPNHLACRRSSESRRCRTWWRR